jgi:PHD/YefM family antitoxin component YafN of YafNO toxin-antitoxin module
VVDPRGNVSYVLVSESEYETVRDILEDEQRQRSIRAVGLRNAIGRMSEVP